MRVGGLFILDPERRCSKILVNKIKLKYGTMLSRIFSLIPAIKSNLYFISFKKKNI